MPPFFAPQQSTAAPPAGQVPFRAHIEVLQELLARRSEIVASIERLLNCQKKPIEYQQDFALLSRQFRECFLANTGPRDQPSPGAQLEQAHWASGFTPRAHPGNDLVDPVEQLMRAFHLWRQTHWPGQKGRVRFAHTLFNLYLVRCLALLCMRVWDEDTSGASARLCQAQAVLDEAWRSSPPDQPRLVRDVRWLFAVAMSPTTDALSGYFDAAQLIADTFADEDRLETFKAWVQTGAGHLRSQLRHLAEQRDVALADASLVLVTRMSNALDLALLVQGLVILLEAYERCRGSGGDERARLELAAAICQGISPDPELFVNRPDLLGPYSMIEHLFITTNGEGQAIYTAMGKRHLALLRHYADLVARLAQPLYDDWMQGKALDTYSPYGVLYGFASNLIELMAFKALQRDAAMQFSMEDIFTDGDAGKLAWVNGWRKLPHIKPHVIKHFEYPRQFAEDISARIEQALHKRVAAIDANANIGRLFVLSEEASQADSQLKLIPDLPLRYIVSSDPLLVAAHKAQWKDQDDLLHCRLEGEFVVSYETDAGWLAITKDLLTEVLGAGRDARIAGLPRVAGDVLRLMCPTQAVLAAAGTSG